MLEKAKKLLLDYLEDVLILTGLIFINWATFRISVTAGLYCLGVSFLGAGALLARHPPKGR